jgi:hypothetical protein
MSGVILDDLQELSESWQGVVYFPGDGLPLVLSDNDDSVIDKHVEEWTDAQRNVMATRLRYWAYQVEKTL